MAEIAAVFPIAIEFLHSLVVLYTSTSIERPMEELIRKLYVVLFNEWRCITNKNEIGTNDAVKFIDIRAEPAFGSVWAFLYRLFFQNDRFHF